MGRVSLRTLLVIAFASFAGLGLASNLLGTSWPSMQVEFDRPVADLGFLIAVGIAAGGVAAAASGRIGRLIGSGAMLVTAMTMFTGSLVVFSLASEWGFIVLAMVVGGIGHGLLDPTINTHVAKEHGTRMMNLLHSSFGIGGIFGPLLVAWSLTGSGSWRWAFGATGAAGLLMLASVFATRNDWHKVPPPTPNAPRDVDIFWSSLPYLLSFSLAVGVEIALGQWAFSVLTERGTAVAAAARFVASFWGGLTVGRLIGVVVGDRVPQRTTLMMSASGVGFGLLVLAINPAGLGPWGLPIAGFGMALVFPTMVVASARRFGDQADIVIGWSLAAASAGGAAVPWIVGIAGSRLGLDAIPPLLLLGVAALTVTFWIATSRRFRAVAS